MRHFVHIGLYVITAFAGMVAPFPAIAQSQLNKNLVVNGDAEAGAGVIDNSTVAAIPAWTRQGSATVLRYGPEEGVLVTDPGPTSRGINFFAGGLSTDASTLSQTIDLSTTAAAIDSKSTAYALSAYIGGYSDYSDSVSLRADFRAVDGSVLRSVTLGPSLPDDRNLTSGLKFRSASGILPLGVRSVVVLLSFTGATNGFKNGFADNISLTLTNPSTLSYGANLLVNPNAESGPTDVTSGNAIVPDIPGWAPTGAFTVLDYADDGGPPTASAGPLGSGRGYFAGGQSNPKSSAAQQIIISGAASAIDQGVVTFQLSGYLGGYSSQEDNAQLDITFRDSLGKALSTATLTPVTAAERNNETSFVLRTTTGSVPAGSRVVDVVLTMTRLEGSYNDGYADNLNFSLKGPASVPTLSAGGIANSASYNASAVSPGEIVTLFGTNIGPANLIGLTVTNGKVDSTLASTRVLFDNIPAPLIYVAASQISAVVPYGVTGATQVSVEYQGQRSNSLSIPVADAVPGIFTSNSSGGGQGAVLNQDNSINSATNPAARGSVIIIYATGEGRTTPAGQDGQVNVSSLPAPNLKVTVTIGGQPATLNYAGAAPSFVSGVLQVNAVIPVGVTPGAAVPLSVTVGNTQSQSGVTVAIK